MFQYSKDEVIQLTAAFRSIRRYADKVAFFDLHFSIVPFSFPPFDTDLFQFFSVASVAQLTDILKSEQKNPALLERVFDPEGSGSTFDRSGSALNRSGSTFDGSGAACNGSGAAFDGSGSTYVFSIKPTNSNAVILNSYVLSSFLLREIGGADRTLDQCADMVSFIKKRVDADYERRTGVDRKLMTVFLKGYSDRLNDVARPIFERKRKFLELYLYAYGYRYAQHMQGLSVPQRDGGQLAALTLERKLELLSDLGLLEGIKRKYYSLQGEELKMKAAEIVAFITGEHSKKLSDKIAPLFTK